MDALWERVPDRNNSTVAPSVRGKHPPLPNLDAFPGELKALDQWLAWRYEERDGKKTKVPYSPDAKRLRKADSTDQNTWGSLGDAVHALERGPYDGSGFVFSPDDPICGVDIDNCINAETGEIDERAHEIVELLDSYTELSPSGTGLHIFVKADLSALEGRRKGAVEMYDRGRFFTVTGEVYGKVRALNNRQEALEQLHHSIFAKPTAAPKSAVPTAPSPAANLDDEKLRERMFASKHGAVIRALWQGDYSAYVTPATTGRSEADLALAAHLMWWTGNDLKRADALFRQSALLRPKWDEMRGAETYGARTLSQAVATDGGYSAQVAYGPGPAVVAGQQGSPPAEKAARRKIVLAADLHTQATEIINALNELNSPPEIFQRGRELVRIIRTDGVSSIETLTLDSIRSFAQGRLECVKLVPTNKAAGKPALEEAPANLTRDVAAFIMTAGSWPFAELRGIVHNVHFSAAGELVSEPGYSPKSRLYLDLGNFTPRPVNPAPTALEVETAKNLILEELLGDFPFADEASRAHAVALGVLPYVRVMIDGPTPLHASDASTPGTGKSLLVEALTYAATGMSPKVLAEGRDDEEWRKRITSTLLESPSTVMIDNINRRLDSGALSSVLTSRVWSDRMLGQSRNATVPNLACWTATGNNLVTSNEVARRLIWIRLDARMEQPWKRESTEFRHPELMAWVGSNRHDIVWAFCTLVQNWLAQGRPGGSARLGSYEAWGEVVGGILSAASIPSFLGNLDALYERADAESGEWREFVNLWYSQHQNREVTVAALYALASEHDALLTVRGDKGEQSQKIRLGRALSKREDRIVGQYTICKGSGSAKQKVQTYYLEAQAEPGGESGGELGQKAGSGGELKNTLPARETASETRVKNTAGSGGECNDISSVKTQEVPSHKSTGENPGELPATPRQHQESKSSTQENGRGVEKHTPRHSPPLPAHSPPFWPTAAEHPYSPDTSRLEYLQAAIRHAARQGRRFTDPLAVRSEALATYLEVCKNGGCAELRLKPDHAAADELRVEALTLYGAARERKATGSADLIAWAAASEALLAKRREAN